MFLQLNLPSSLFFHFSFNELYIYIINFTVLKIFFECLIFYSYRSIYVSLITSYIFLFCFFLQDFSFRCSFYIFCLLFFTFPHSFLSYYANEKWLCDLRLHQLLNHKFCINSSGLEGCGRTLIVLYFVVFIFHYFFGVLLHLPWSFVYPCLL